MASRATVVRNCSKTPKPTLHAQLMAGWTRCIARFGKGGFADALEISTVGLDKQLTGSMPDFATIMDAFDHDDTVLDDVFAGKGKRIVDRDAVCETDDIKLLVARVNLKLQEYTHPDSPAGEDLCHTEYLDGEALMRELNRQTAEWLDRCATIRRPSHLRSAA